MKGDKDIYPKRNIDHIIELWESGKEEAAGRLFEDCTMVCDGYESNDDIRCLLAPYTEPSKYPKLTPDEIKAVKWLVDGGFYQIESLGFIGANTMLGKNSFLRVCHLSVCKCLAISSWITETPINLKELLDAQEDI